MSEVCNGFAVTVLIAGSVLAGAGLFGYAMTWWECRRLRKWGEEIAADQDAFWEDVNTALSARSGAAGEVGDG